MNELLKIKIDGKLFDNKLDLRDVAFFSKKVSSITDKAYSAYTGKSSDLKDKYSIITKEINHSSLEIHALLDYGGMIAPLLMENPSSVLQTAQIAMESIYKLGELFRKEEKINLNIENSTIDTLVIGNNNDLKHSIPKAAFQTMLNIDNDIKDINKKISNGNINSFKINEQTYLDNNKIDYVNKGLEFVEQLKEEIVNEEYRATLSIYEFNKNTLTGKARIISHNMFEIDVKENIDLNVPSECIEDIIIAMNQETIEVKFQAIIENIVSKKTLKKIIIVNCEK